MDAPGRVRTLLAAGVALVVVAGGLVVAAPAAHAAAAGNYFEPVTPVRLLDTRTGLGAPGGLPGPLGPDGDLVLQVAGENGVPDDATAVVVTLTAIRPTHRTFVSVLPGDSTGVPTTSNLNPAAADTVAGEATVPLGADGTLRVYNSVGTVGVVMDLQGFYAPDQLEATQTFAPLFPLPVRIRDEFDQAIVAGHDVAITVDAVPADATAVVMNVTAVAPSASTYVTVLPTGAAMPDPPVSNINVARGKVVASLVTVALAPGRQVTLHNAVGSVNLYIDVAGYYAPDAGSLFYPTAPVRLLDTRTHLGEAPGQTGRLGPGGAVDVQMTGVAGMPAKAMGAVFTLTAVGADSSGYLQAFPSPAANSPPSFPILSTINTVPGTVAANHVAEGIGGGGRVRVRNKAGTVDALLDLVGWFHDPTTGGVDHGAAPATPSVRGLSVAARVGTVHPRIKTQLPVYATTAPGSQVSFKVYFPTVVAGYSGGTADSLGHAAAGIYVRPDSLGRLIKVVVTSRNMTTFGAQTSTVIMFVPVK